MLEPLSAGAAVDALAVDDDVRELRLIRLVLAFAAATARHGTARHGTARHGRHGTGPSRMAFSDSGEAWTLPTTQTIRPRRQSAVDELELRFDGGFLLDRTGWVQLVETGPGERGLYLARVLEPSAAGRGSS